MKLLIPLLFMLWLVIQITDYIFDLELFPPDYVVYTHRKGWMHCSKMTKQDEKEISGMCMPYLELK